MHRESINYRGQHFLLGASVAARYEVQNFHLSGVGVRYPQFCCCVAACLIIATQPDGREASVAELVDDAIARIEDVSYCN
jgi:hypothetical protein